MLQMHLCGTVPGLRRFGGALQDPERLGDIYYSVGRQDAFRSYLRVRSGPRMMSSHLCAVCFSISTESSNFWSSAYDSPEYCQETFIKLQSYRRMCKEAEKGCQLCTVLLNFPRPVQVEDKNAILILRRCPAYPDRAVRLGTGPKGLNYITRTFYRQVPNWWWGQSHLQSDHRYRSATSDNVPEVPSTLSREHDPNAYNRPTNLDSSIDNIRLMKMWLHGCQTNHKDCSINPKRFLPTRLIDVQAFRDSSDVRLVDSEPLKVACNRKCIPYPNYLALSHCWGPPSKQPITTKAEDLENRKTRISVKDLSKTFLDAVVIARRLGERYLWIDSLCIIQDVSKDWQVEAALMADVYGNAYCTLSAFSSEDGTQGCRMISDLRKSTGNSFLEFQVCRETQTYVRMYRQPPAIWSAEYGEEPKKRGQSLVRNPLRYRGWTLQEAELSRRTIFFADRQLLWRCRKLRGTTELPWAEQLSDEVFKMKSWPLCDGLQDDQTEGIFSDTRLRWYQLVEDYSLRKLTYDKDRLTALAGLAKTYQDIFPGAKYVAGMWGPHIPRVPLFRPSDNLRLQNDLRHKLHAGAAAIGAHCSATLLWRSMDKEARRYPEYTAPTWSWASVNGRISYDSQRVEPHGNSFDRMGVREELSDCDFGGMQWDGMTAKAKNGDPYGAVERGACLVLRGARMAQCSVPKETSSGFFAKSQRAATRQDSFLHHINKHIPSTDDEVDADGEPLTVNGKTVGVFFRDSADDDPLSESDTFCLRIRGEPFFSSTHHRFKGEQEINGMEMVMGIVLIRTWSRELGETYLRVGLARWVSAALFRRSQPTSLKLV